MKAVAHIGPSFLGPNNSHYSAIILTMSWRASSPLVDVLAHETCVDRGVLLNEPCCSILPNRRAGGVGMGAGRGQQAWPGQGASEISRSASTLSTFTSAKAYNPATRRSAANIAKLPGLLGAEDK